MCSVCTKSGAVLFLKVLFNILMVFLGLLVLEGVTCLIVRKSISNPCMLILTGNEGPFLMQIKLLFFLSVYNFRRLLKNTIIFSPHNSRTREKYVQLSAFSFTTEQDVYL
jgi:hypothetical protein